MTQPTRLAIICGGQSTEHKISIVSAKNVAAGFSPKRYDVSIIYITPQGEWWLIKDLSTFLENPPHSLCHTDLAEPVTMVLGDVKCPLQSLRDSAKRYAVDCFFPVLHGAMGEDGTIQGLLELSQKPFVGSHTLGCALSMHKGVTKEVLAAHNLPVVPWIEISHHEKKQFSYDVVSKKLGSVLFIKPARLGSSVGIHKISNQAQWDAALADGFRYDDTILVEAAIEGRELECGVLGNDAPQASMPGEITTQHEFYSYQAKYLDAKGTKTITVADLDEQTANQIRAFSIKAFKAARCSGLLRVDFFLQPDGTLYINELNAIPGFTDISMYPQMWSAAGVGYSELLDKLVQLAFEYYDKQRSYIKIYQDADTQDSISSKSQQA